MSTQYIYASTRSKVLEYALMNETQIERLISAKSEEEAIRSLHDTFLATYIAQQKEGTVTTALDTYIQETKQLLGSISPEPELLNILWLKYDLHNVKAIIKGKRQGVSDEDIISHCFRGGTMKPETLLKAISDQSLNTISNDFVVKAYKAGQDAENGFLVSIAINHVYFDAIRALAKNATNTFVKEYVGLLINLHNLKASLRAINRENMEVEQVFVPGGTYSVRDLTDEDGILERFQRHGNGDFWTEAISTYRKNGEYGQLEKIADEYTGRFLKERGRNLFSIAPLFSYFTALKLNAQTIGSALAAKRSGLSEKELRTLLRRVYA